MRKSFVVASIAVLLGASWLGGAWYTGKIVEQNYVSHLELAAQHLNEKTRDIGIFFHIEEANIERGLFDSAINYVLQVNQGTQESYQIPFSGKIYHGPITLDDFSFALLSSHSHIVKNPFTQGLFRNEQSNPLDIRLKVSYANQFKGYLFSDVAMNIGRTQFEWLVKSEFDLDKNGFGKQSLQMPIFTIKENEQYTLNVQDLDFNSDVHFVEKWKNVALGSYQIKAKQIGIIESDKAKEIRLDELGLDFSLTEKDSFIDLVFNYNIKDILVGQTSLAGLDLQGKIAHIDAEALDVLIRQNINGTDEGINKVLFDPLIRKILNNSPYFVFDKLKVFNQKGQALLANLNLQFTSDALDTLDKGKIWPLFEQLRFTVQLDKKALLQLFHNMLLVNGEPEVKQRSEEMLAEFLQLAKKYHFLIEDDNGASLELFLDKEKNKLIFNQQELPVQELGMLLLLLMMRQN